MSSLCFEETPRPVSALRANPQHSIQHLSRQDNSQGKIRSPLTSTRGRPSRRLQTPLHSSKTRRSIFSRGSKDFLWLVRRKGWRIDGWLRGQRSSLLPSSVQGTGLATEVLNDTYSRCAFHVWDSASGSKPSPPWVTTDETDSFVRADHRLFLKFEILLPRWFSQVTFFFKKKKKRDFKKPPQMLLVTFDKMQSKEREQPMLLCCCGILSDLKAFCPVTSGEAAPPSRVYVTHAATARRNRDELEH